MGKCRFKIAALAMGVLLSAFFMPDTAYASDGNGSVDIDLPKGWQTKEYVAQITPYEFTNGNTKVYAQKVSASFDDGAYLDITDCMQVTLRENGMLSVKVEYSDGSETTGSFYIENFDLERPSVSARLEGEIMYLTAKDEISGVKEISINGKVFHELKDGQMCIDVKELESTQEYFTIYAKDTAGNLSKTFKVKNPYYVGEPESGSSDKSLVNPDSIEATDPTSARGSVTEYTDSKEFYTITADDKTFYLVIDHSMSQENVYLLTEAGCNDLLNFVDYNGVDVENGDIPLYELSEEEISVPDSDNTEEVSDAKESKTDSSAFVIIAIAAVAGGGYYFVKQKKKKDELDDAEEMDAFDIPSEDEELTEDDMPIGVSVEYVNGDGE